MFFLFVGLMAGIVALAHTAPFPFLLDKLGPAPSAWRMPVPPGSRTLYLTFDDGPNPRVTPALLDVLAAEKATATFFLIDRHLTDETVPLVRRMFADGHAVGLHSHTRKLMLMEPEDIAATLTAAADRVERLAGSRPCPIFRPHAGWRSGAIFAGLSRIEHALVGWTFLLWDWNWFRKPTADAVVPRLLKHAAPGAIIVMHDGHHENPRADRAYTVEATRRLIPALRAKGYSFGTICRQFAPDDAGRPRRPHQQELVASKFVVFDPR
jgi:chitooligosaccharide deacetylase